VSNYLLVDYSSDPYNVSHFVYLDSSVS